MSAFDPRFAINPRFEDLAACNAVLNARAGDYHVESYRTTLSLKSVVAGTALYRAGRGRFRINGDSLLVLNHGQTYALDIVDGGTETLCLFFQPGFVERVARELAFTTTSVVDEPEVDGRGDFGFGERLHAKSGRVASALSRLHEGLGQPAGPWLEGCMYELAAELVGVERGARREIEHFPGARPATRAELYRRLHSARDCIDSSFHEHWTLARMARVACLSPYHFQRMFKAAFRVTPAAHLQSRRLAAARELLARTDRDVTSIALDVGFESLGSFSWLFRRRFGVSPREFRKRGRKDGASEDHAAS